MRMVLSFLSDPEEDGTRRASMRIVSTGPETELIESTLVTFLTGLTEERLCSPESASYSIFEPRPGVWEGLAEATIIPDPPELLH